jgi:hypothetical protein
MAAAGSAIRPARRAKTRTLICIIYKTPNFPGASRAKSALNHNIRQPATKQVAKNPLFPAGLFAISMCGVASIFPQLTVLCESVQFATLRSLDAGNRNSAAFARDEKTSSVHQPVNLQVVFAKRRS